MQKRIDDIDMNKLLKVLLLLEINNNLSAHTVALKERSRNRKEAIDILQKELEITDEQLEEMYQTFLNE